MASVLKKICPTSPKVKISNTKKQENSVCIYYIWLPNISYKKAWLCFLMCKFFDIITIKLMAVLQIIQ